MNIRSAAFAALIAVSGPGIAQAFTVTAENNTDAAHTAALLNGLGSNQTELFGWSLAGALEIDPGVSTGGQARSPWERDNQVLIASPSQPSYFSVGVTSFYTANGAGQTATLDLGGDHKAFSLLWGSPDRYNTLELLNNGGVVLEVLGSSFTVPSLGASFVTISAGIGEVFDAVRFTSTSNAFEWASMSATPVPLPTPVMLLLASLAGLGFLSRKRKMIAA